MPQQLRWTLWWLIVVGLLVRSLRQPTIAGTYDGRLDELLYAGQRLLEGQWLYDGLVNGSQPLVQLLYAPSAWLGRCSYRCQPPWQTDLPMPRGCSGRLFIRQTARPQLGSGRAAWREPGL
ncbi:MAG: hypothetical protein ACKO22_10200, partial [Cyanobium sp.]